MDEVTWNGIKFCVKESLRNFWQNEQSFGNETRNHVSNVMTKIIKRLEMNGMSVSSCQSFLGTSQWQCNVHLEFYCYSPDVSVDFGAKSRMKEKMGYMMIEWESSLCCLWSLSLSRHDLLLFEMTKRSFSFLHTQPLRILDSNLPLDEKEGHAKNQ